MPWSVVPGRWQPAAAPPLPAGGPAAVAQWQATQCCGRSSRNAGASAAQRADAQGQRVRRRQPEGGSIGLGSSPSRVMRRGRWPIRLHVGGIALLLAGTLTASAAAAFGALLLAMAWTAVGAVFASLL